VWCPLRDIKALLKGKQANASIWHHSITPFFQCAALHYLCWPLQLEALSVFDFFSRYEVIRMTSTTKPELLPFCNGHYRRPSYRVMNDRFLQGVRQRKQEHLIKVYQYDFPDTNEFNGCLLNENPVISKTMETYYELVLLLFYPHRILTDITLNGSYTLKVREAVAHGIIVERAQSFLQNLQDARSNSFCVQSLQDDLQQNTEPFARAHDTTSDRQSDPTTPDNDEGTELQEQHLEELLTLLDMEAGISGTPEPDDNTAAAANALPQSVSLKSIRQKGTLNCGYDSLATMSLDLQCSDPLTEVQQAPAQASQAFKHPTISNAPQQETPPNQREIAKTSHNQNRQEKPDI
jgi:hypothetical protein